jgi:perosamine synthetase
MNQHKKLSEHRAISGEIITAIRKVVGMYSTNLHEPVFEGNEWHYLKDCLDSGFVSSAGQYVEKFEQKIAEFTGSKYAIALVNGTSALHLAMIVGGVKSGDEVIMPSLTFVATANAVSYTGAIPHFVDVNQLDLGIDAVKLRQYLNEITVIKNGNCLNRKTGRIIRALLPMHVFGHPCNILELLAIADEFHLTVIEDAAESLGSFYNEKHTGTFGKIGIISFNGNKTITTGGGGVILTDDREIAYQAKYLSTTAKQPHAFSYMHTDIGFNYRMPNLNAALGCAQLEKLPYFLNSKRRLFNLYFDAFFKVENVLLFQEPIHCRSNYWLQTLLLDEELVPYHEDIIISCIKSGINVRPVWTPLHLLPIFADSPAASLPVTINLAKRLINIPSSAGIS